MLRFNEITDKIDGWMDRWMDGWMDGWTLGYKKSCKYIIHSLSVF